MLLLFWRLSFTLLIIFFCCAEMFRSDLVPLFYFCFHCICLWHQYQKIITKSSHYGFNLEYLSTRFMCSEAELFECGCIIGVLGSAVDYSSDQFTAACAVSRWAWQEEAGYSGRVLEGVLSLPGSSLCALLPDLHEVSSLPLPRPSSQLTQDCNCEAK